MNSTQYPLVQAAFPLAAMLVWFAGCDASSGAGGTVVRDSSGVTIVENGDSAAVWSAEHQLSIGDANGGASSRVDRVQGATRLPDGRIVVVNGGSADLRFFGSDGTHLHTVGGSGSGPGEFRSPSSLQRRGDTLVVWDYPRITLLNTLGELIGTEGMERMRFALTIQAHGTPLSAERLADGSFIIRVDPTSEPRPAGEYRPEIGLTWMNQRLEQSHLIGTFPDTRHVNVGTAFQPMALPVPLSAGLRYAAGGEPLRVYVSWSDALEVLVYTTDGQLQRIIRKTQTAVPISEEALVAVYEQRLSSLAQTLTPDQAERRLNLVPDPETYPALDGLFVDTRGWLWTRRFLTPFDTSTHFSVFDTAGVLRGEIEVPRRFEPLEATADYVLGLSVDELQVERVELYAVVR